MILTPSRQRRAHGVALLMVLSIISLVGLLAVLFLALATSARQSSAIYRDAAQAQFLGTTAVHLAMGQLQLATTPEDILPRFWASQPGAIRTWKDDGSADRLFKLYSSSESVVTIADPPARLAARQREQSLLALWNPESEISQVRFADLNEPLLLRDAEGRVVDARFPIADPRAMTLDGVEGFSLPNGGLAGTQLSPGPEARLPMPVEWIYVLDDGSLGTLDSEGQFVPAQDGGAFPSKENPICGRIAFWTDDESCKVNLNTAAEGIPWDTPRCVNRKDIEYARTQPVANEVQRWPGHPSTVCLSSVFFPGVILEPGNGQWPALKALYDLAPRVHYENQAGQLAGAFGQGSGAIRFDKDRLYASVDEALYQPDRSLNTLFTLPGQSPARLDRSRFFLTTHSRSPELNLHGHPRVCLWPVHRNSTAQSNRVTTHDRAIRFTTSLGQASGFEYHVQRDNPASQVDEYHLNAPLRRNSALAAYLDTELHRPLPKYGLSFFDKYPANDLRLNIYRSLDFIRSTNLHDTSYLRADRQVTPYQDVKIPGIVSGCAFSELAGKEGVPSWVQDLVNYRIPGRDYTLSEVALVFVCAAHHTRDGQKIGPGLFFAGTGGLRPGEKALQAALLFETFCTEQGHVMALPHLRLRLDSPTLMKMRVNGSSLENGGAPHDHDQISSVWGFPPFTYANTKPKSPSRDPATRRPDNWVGWGGSGGFHIFTSPIVVRDGVEQPKPAAERTGYYTEEWFRVAEDEPLTITSEAGDALQLDLTLERTWVSVWDTRQHLRVRFPLPLQTPSPVIDPAQPTLWSWKDRMTHRANLAVTSAYDPASPYDQLLLPGDVVRSMVVAHGDYRLPDVWGRKTGRFNDVTQSVTEDYFAPHPDYHQAEVFQAHSLMPSGGDSSYYASSKVTASGFLPPSVAPPYPAALKPDLPISPTKPASADDPFARSVLPAYLSAYGRQVIEPSISRDWNNGTGIAPDGAYTGKPDDGSRSQGGADRPPFSGNLPPYFNKRWENPGADSAVFDEGTAPNRLVTSAAIFGSFPSMPTSNVPWTTWLFRPDLSEGHVGSPWNTYQAKRYHGPESSRPNGRAAPPDHLLSDLFWMPVVTPYVVSERFATAGKVNLNHRMLPFEWIERSTALHAALKAEEILAIPTTAAADYKDPEQVQGNTREWRHRIDTAATLKQLEPVFDSGDALVSPGEICEHFLVPRGQNIQGTATGIAEQMRQFWRDHALTGDNVLERPYASLLAKLTTRSNVFRVHFRAQVLQKARSTPPDRFDPLRDRVTGEFRGDALIERFLPPQPDDPDGYPDPATDPQAPSFDRYYHYRILHQKRFAQ